MSPDLAVEVPAGLGDLGEVSVGGGRRDVAAVLRLARDGEGLMDGQLEVERRGASVGAKPGAEVEGGVLRQGVQGCYGSDAAGDALGLRHLQGGCVGVGVGEEVAEVEGR